MTTKAEIAAIAAIEAKSAEYARSVAALKADQERPPFDERAYRLGYEHGYAAGWTGAIESLVDMAPTGVTVQLVDD